MKPWRLPWRKTGAFSGLAFSTLTSLLLCGTSAPAQSCDLFPIALSAQSLSNATPGAVLSDICNGSQPGGFGWLTWGGSPSEPTLVKSLTPPGDSFSYVNPEQSSDHQVTAGDWVRSKPGVSNSKHVRDALEALKNIDVTVPVWNEAIGQGANALYRISAFARVRLISYQLPQQNRITAQFLGYANCEVTNQAPTVNAGADQTVTLPATVSVTGEITDDGRPAGAQLAANWTAVSGPGAVSFSAMTRTNDLTGTALSTQLPSTLTFTVSGTYLLRLTASDSQFSSSDDLIVTVSRDNHPPQALPQTLTVHEDTSTNLTLQGTDADGDALAFPVTVAPQYGTLSGTPPDLTYTPKPDYNGPDEFAFKANDGLLDSPNALVTITILPVNDAPIADAQSVTNFEDTPFPITLSGSDLEGSPLTYAVSQPPAHGTLNGTAPHLTYSPATNYFGPDTFAFQVGDGTNVSAPALMGITVLPVDDPPLVDAGADQLLVLPINTAHLDGAVTYDVFPGIVENVEWTLVSGPGTVTFGDPSNEVTTATFGQSGVYQLRLTAGDSFLTGSDDVVITVDAPPVVSAGADQTNTLPATVTLEGGVTDDGIPSNAVSVAWEKVSGPGTVVFSNPDAAGTTAAFGESGRYVLRLTARDGAASGSDELTVLMNRAPMVDAGSDQALTGLEITLTGTPFDDGLPAGNLTVTWSKVSGPGAVIFANANAAATTAAFSTSGIYILELAANDGISISTDTIRLLLNDAPVVSAGPGLDVTLGEAVRLHGTVTDDGLPSSDSLAMTWTLVSGQGQVLLENPNSPVTGVSFSGAGTYLFRLTATDSMATNSADVTVIVNPVNQPPAVSVGPKQLVVLPGNASLQGVVTDDSLPAGESLAFSWSKVSGPGNVTFAHPASTNTTASFSEAGDYIVQLTASDSVLSAAAEMKISVRTPAMNQPPNVSAGPDLVVGLTNSAVLRGAAADDGLPQGSSLTVNWSVISGPGTVTFENAGVTNARATFSALGTYVVRLTANDSAFSASSDVTVTVYPFNQPPVVDAGPDQTIVVPDPSLLVASGAMPIDPSLELSRSLLSVPRWNNAVGQPGFDGFVGWKSLSWSGKRLYAGGGFHLSGTNFIGQVAGWDGTNWSGLYDPTPAFPGGPPFGFMDSGNYIQGLSARGDEVFILGGFLRDREGDQHGDASMRWDGSNWVAWHPYIVSGAIEHGDVLAMPDSVYLAGSYTMQLANWASGAGSLPGVPFTTNLISWDGTNWGTQGGGVSGRIKAAAVGRRGEVYVCGDLQLATPTGIASNIAVWNGTNWTPLGPGLAGVQASAPMSMTVDELGNLYVAGHFSHAGGKLVNDVAKWDGTDWSALGDGQVGITSGHAEIVTAYGRDIYVGGANLLAAGGLTVNGIARWNGQRWFALQRGSAQGVAGFTVSDSGVTALTAAANGVYIGGAFTSAGGQPAYRIAFWEYPELPERGVVLQGRVTDDGLPTGAPLTATWTKLSGPGDVTFSDPHSAIAGARFSRAGQYVLRLIASDTDLTGLDEVTINVRANQPPAVNAGADQVIGLDESLALPGSVSDDGLPEDVPVYHTWSVVRAPGQVTIDHPDQTNSAARFSQQGTYVLRLSANDSQFTASDELVVIVKAPNQPPSVFAGSSVVIMLGSPRQMNASVTDDQRPVGVLNTSWSVLSGPALVSFDNANKTNAVVSFSTNGVYELRLTANDSQLSAFGDVTIVVNAPAGNPPPVPPPNDNQPPTVNAGPDAGALTFAPFLLDGSVSDDDLPVGSSLSVNWHAVSGPARVYFSDAHALKPHAHFSAAGTYVLGLVANDSQFSVTDDAVITVTVPTNQPPAVFAGLPMAVTRPNPAALQGLVFDDGLPLGFAFTSAWSKVSGPGNVTFSPGTTDLLARAFFSAPGDYVLRLTAGDSQFNVFDDVDVTVFAGTNAPPFAHAGPDFAAVLSVPAILHTEVSDDGLENGLLEIHWSLVSGPGQAYFSTVNGVYQASFTAPGDYALRLTANDGSFTRSDDAAVTVYDAAEPVAQIHLPFDGAIITSPTQVIGTASSPILQSYVLEYRLAPPASGLRPPTSDWSVLSSGSTSVISNTLGTLDPTLALNGIYELRLTATDLLGRSATTDPVTVVFDRNLKIGHFTISFSDLAIPVPGLPLQITRTYDSRAAAAGVQGDFGIGWTLDIRNVRLQKNRPLGRNWTEYTTGSPFDLSLAYHLDPGKPRLVTITFPDGQVQKFRLDPDPMDRLLVPIDYPRWRFTPIGNTRGTLVPAGYDAPDGRFLFFAGAIPGTADLVDLNFFFDALDFNSNISEADLQRYPTLFRYTSPEGYHYLIDEIAGLQNVSDPNGNTLLISTNGLTWTNSLAGTDSSGGPSVAFQRDALGRITNIVDAMGQGMSYRYDTNADLVTFANRDGNTNAFAYDAQHRLLTLTDTRGVQVIGNQYSGEGRLLSTTDALGHAMTYGHDLENRREYVTNRLGFVTINEYDEHGNIVRTTDPTGAVASFVYDQNGNLLVKSNANGCGCAVLYTYDEFDNRTSETDAQGNATAFTYNQLRKVLTLTEPSGFSTTNTYDANGNLLSTRDSAGQVAAFTYNTAGKVTSMLDAKGARHFAYNESGILTNEVNALGHVTDYTVDANGNMLSQAIAVNRVTGFASLTRYKNGWEVAGTPVVIAGTVTNVARLVMRYEYTPSGLPLRTLYYDSTSTENIFEGDRVKTTTDVLGRQTTSDYNAAGQLVRKTYPNSCQETFDYDAEGQLISSTDRRGFETRYEYDPRGKLVRTIFADGSQISATHYADGSLHSETSRSGEVTSYQIDGDGNRVQVEDASGPTRYTYNYKRLATSKTDPLNRTNRYEYDALSRNTEIIYPDGSRKTAAFSGRLVTSETNQNGHATSYEYDALGRLVAVTDALGNSTHYGYDEQGNKIAETDPLGRTTFFEYDTMSRRVRTVYADGSTVSTGYDAAGRVLTQTNQLGDVTFFAYDLANNLTNNTDPLGRVTRCTYDCGGNRLTQTDPDGQTTRFDYDALNRRTRTTFPDGTNEELTYDLAGRMIAQTDQAGKSTRFAYDIQNRLIAVTNTLGDVTRFGYDAAGNRTAEIDPQNHVTRHEYDQLDRMVRTIYHDGTTQEYAYDPVGRLTAQKDQAGKTSRFVYDAVGRLLSATDPLEHATSYTYDAAGNRLSQTDPRGKTTRFEYDRLNRRTRTIFPDGTSRSVSYDRAGLPVAETDPVGNATVFEFDAVGERTAMQDALGHTTCLEYDARGRVRSRTDADHQTTSFQYDSLGRLTRTVYPDGSSSSAVYDAKGRRISATDPNGNTARFAYDDLDRLISQTDALNQTATFAYDSLGRLISRTDANNHTTGFEYDALGRLTRTAYPDGTSRTAAYDAKGRLVAATDSRGHTTTFAYDDADRLASRTDALGHVTHYAYDGLGRLTATTDANSHTTSFEYDDLGRLVRTIYADGTTRENQYDLLSRRIGETDQAGVVKRYAYDPIGRLIAVTNALDQPTRFAYDAVGRLLAQMDANNHTTTFEYDALGRRTKRILPGGQTESFRYDPAGNLTNRINFKGHVTSYTYDALNRLTQKLPDPVLVSAGAVPVTFDYSPTSRRVRMTDASGTTTYSYDLRDRLIARATPQGTLAYGYDANGNVTNIVSTNPNGTAMSYEYDPLNRLSGVNDARVGRTTYHFDDAGNLQNYVHPNGVNCEYQYDLLNRLTNLACDKALTPLAHYAYTLGPSGTRTTVTESLLPSPLNPQPGVINRGYGYDLLYRLTNETITGAAISGSASYTYDHTGNRIMRASTVPSLPDQNFTYDVNDRLTSDVYDANGNTIQALDPQHSTLVQDDYDFEDHLVTRHTTLNSQPSTINLIYDGDGNRVRKTVTTGTNSVTTSYLVDDLNPTGYPQVLEELESSALRPQPSVLRVYTCGLSLLSEDQFDGSVWRTSFYGIDGHGSVRYLTDINGQVTDTFDYDAFGNLIARSGTTPNNFLFAGEQFDPDLGLYYLRARYAEPGRGRFWTMDTFEGFGDDPPSLHKYTFNQNDPVNRIDPSGHMTLLESGQVGGLAPMVRGVLLSMADGINHFTHGLAGGNMLKFTSRSEAYMIDSLAVGPGWKFGKEDFWAAAKGAPFLLAQNPNVTTSRKRCYYECPMFDLDVPVYGPGAKFPVFEMQESDLYKYLDGAANVALVPFGVAQSFYHSGKGLVEMGRNVLGSFGYAATLAVTDGDMELADKLFGPELENLNAMATGVGRLAVDFNLARLYWLTRATAPGAAEQFFGAGNERFKQELKILGNEFTGGEGKPLGLRGGYTIGNLVPFASLAKLSKVNALGKMGTLAEFAQQARTTRSISRAGMLERLAAEEGIADSLLNAEKTCRKAPRELEAIAQLEAAAARNAHKTRQAIQQEFQFAEDNLSGRLTGRQAEIAAEGGYQFNMVENPGPLAAFRGNPAAGFTSGKYNTITLTEDTILYRAGEAGTPLGQWFTKVPVKSVAEARIDLAIKPQWIDGKTGVLTGSSPIDTSFAVTIPKGTVIYEGPVGSQGGLYVGGQNQIFVPTPWKIPGVKLIGATPLP